MTPIVPPAVMRRLPFAVSSGTVSPPSLRKFGAMQSQIGADMLARARAEGHIGVIPGGRTWSLVALPATHTERRRRLRDPAGE